MKMKIGGYLCHTMTRGGVDLLVVENTALADEPNEIKDKAVFMIMKYCIAEGIFQDGDAKRCIGLVMPSRVIKKLGVDFIMGIAFGKSNRKRKNR